MTSISARSIPIAPRAARPSAQPESGVQLVAGGFGESMAIALLATMLITLGFLISYENCRQWYVIPATICGMLAGTDIVQWVRRRLDTFDPKAILAMMMFHNTYISPLLHEAWGTHTKEWHEVVEWGPWYGTYCIWSAIGLIFYQFGHRLSFRSAKPARTHWVINPNRFATIIMWALAISSIAAAVVLLKFGGLRKAGKSELLATGEGLQHTSWLLMLGDTLPMLIAIAIINALTDKKRKRSFGAQMGILAALAIGQFLLLGLRGSRSAVMSVLFITTGMAHYRLRRIHPGWAISGMIVLFVFAYFYGFYKRAGMAGFAALQSADARHHLERTTGNTMATTLLGDLSRCEMQSFIMYRLTNFPDRYDFRWGKTYFRAAVSIIPRAIWYNKPPGKNEAGTAIQYGEGRWKGRDFESTRVYGLAGEAMLNFGFFGIPPAFFIYGSFLGWYRKKWSTWRSDDSRYFIAPILVLFFLTGYFGDSDNAMFEILKNGSLPILVILVSSSRFRLPDPIAPNVARVLAMTSNSIGRRPQP